MRNIKRCGVSAAVFVCMLLFLYAYPRERAQSKTKEIHGFLFATNELSALVDTLLFEDRRSNTTSGEDKDVLVQHLSEIYGPVSFVSIRPRNTDLTQAEQIRAKICLQNAVSDRDKNGSRFWGKEEHVRTTHHTYLKNKGVVLIEVGGNLGQDAAEFVRLYNPRYIILEPLEDYFNILKENFKNNSKVTVLNVGLGAKKEVVMVNIEGVNACATSKFSGAKGKTPLYITNATTFLMALGVGLFDVDLLTMNCEGCEYEVLETVLSTSLINYIKHIQFATHSTLKGLTDPLGRYCKIQELLHRTHKPTYQYRFIWESWRRDDLL